MQKFFAWISIFSLLLQITSSIFLYGPVLAEEPTPTPTSNVEVTPTPTPTETPVVSPELTPEPSATPEVTPTPDITPTPEASVEPSPSLEPTPTPTPEVTPTPETNVSPNNQPEAPPTVQGEQTQSTPSPEAAPEPTITPTPEPQENGKLAAAILKDTKADSIDELDLDFQGEGSAAISTDKLDYAPTDTVLVTGSGFKADKTYTIYITSSDAPAVSHEDSVTADEVGNLFYSYQLDGNYRPNYKVEVKDGDRVVASTTFTDSEAANLDQYGNKAPVGWQNGNLNESNSVYREGDSIPYRAVFKDLNNGSSYNVTIAWDTTKAGKHAIDYLTSYDRTVSGTNPCDGVTGCNLAVYDTEAIPDDPNSSVTQVPGVFTLFGGTITGLSAYSLSGPYAGDSTTRITITFTANIAKPVLAWGGHIGSQVDWGLGNSAVNIEGSPYHTFYYSCSFGCGSQDKSLKASAVIVPGVIVVNKVTVPSEISGQVFNFTTGGSELNNFQLDTDSGTVTSSTKTFSDLLSGTSGGVRTITETSITGYTTAVSCVSSLQNSTLSTSGNIATISNLGAGDTVTCTFTNTRNQGTIELKKIWSGTGGQTTLNIGTTAGGNQVASEQTGANGAVPLTTGTKTVDTGTYYVSETGGLTNYSSSLACTDNGQAVTPGTDNSLVVASGHAIICTYTNTRQTGTIIVKKVMVGGTSNFAFTGNPSGSISANNGTIQETVDIGQYTSVEGDKSGWNLTSIVCDDSNSTGDTNTRTATFNVEANETVTCTFTNTKESSITIVKDAQPNDAQDFAFTTSGTGLSSFDLDDDSDSTLSNTKAFTGLGSGSYIVTEGLVSGWKLNNLNCTGGNGPFGVSLDNRSVNITLGAGENVTCTFTNTKLPTLLVKKHVVNDNGGGAIASQFTLHLKTGGVDVSGSPASGSETGVSYTLEPGTYTVSENTPILGYTQTGISGDCDSNGNITLTAGDVKSCTITNDDETGHLIVHKATNPTNDQTVFSTTLSSAPASGSTTRDLSTTTDVNYEVNAGTYSVSEEDKAGWDETANTCTRIDIANGQTKECTITNTKLGLISGMKFNDVNGNGIKDPGESGLSGWYINFLGPVVNGTPISGFDDTDINGNYSFLDLVPGTYKVCEVEKNGWSQTFPAADAGCVYGHGYTINLAAGQDSTGNDFGNQGRGTIKVVKTAVGGDDTFNYILRDNVQTPTGLAVTTSGGTGDNSYNNLPAGTYSLAESDTTGWDFDRASCDDGSAIGSISVSAGETVTCDFTNVKRGSVTACKYNDVNGNGVRDVNDDQPLDGWEMTLNPGGIKQPTVNGCTTFNNLSPDNYSVTETLKNDWSNTSGGLTQNITLGAGENKTVNFLNFQCATISGIKWEDTNGNGQKDTNEVGLPNWTINLSKLTHNETDITESDGSYSFKVCEQGLYTINETNPDTNVWYQTYPGGAAPVHLVDVASGGNYSGKDFGNARYAKISGFKYRDNDGDGALDTNDLTDTLSGWVIDLFDGVTNNYITSYTTLVNGYYEFTGLLAGHTYYVLEQLKPGWTQTYGPVPTPTPFEFLSGDNKQVNFANFENISITACKKVDADGNSQTTGDQTDKSGWSVSLNNGQTTDPQTTREGGCYTWNIGPGNYTVSESVPSGWTALTQTEYSFVAESGQNQTVTFINFEKGSISGMKFEDMNGNGVKDVGDNGLDGWQIYLDLNNDNNFSAGEPNTLTAGGGNYTFTNLQPGEYTVKEVLKSGWSQKAPAGGEYLVTLTSGQNVTGKNFGNFNLGEIQGKKYEDLNRNGRHDSNEFIDGWTIRLYKLGDGWQPVGTKVTGHTGTIGQYRFENLDKGNYKICEVMQAGWIQMEPTGAANNVQTDEGPRCREVSITTSNQATVGNQLFGNIRNGTIIVHKVTDPRDAEESFDIDLRQEGLVHTYNLADGEEESFDTLAGEYTLDEQLLAGWDLTSAVCTSNEETREKTEFDPRQRFTLNPGEIIDCTFTNTIKNPALTITKINDATGDRHPGDSVLFTLTVTATQSGVRDVHVTDVLPEGFKYRGGSWTASSNVNLALSVTEPTYASPGVWDLGNMVKGETITLTYIADIDGNQDPGLYKDLAWAQGKSLRGCGTVVLALATDPGFVATNFVGTQVNVVKDQQSGVSYNVESKVLGASTSMPATGADSRWLVLSGILFVLGWNVLLAGLILRRKHA